MPFSRLVKVRVHDLLVGGDQAPLRLVIGEGPQRSPGKRPFASAGGCDASGQWPREVICERGCGTSAASGLFNDALTKYLKRGRCLLLIVGDGIREDVDAISEYLERHAGLHFSFALVEMPIYDTPNDDCLVAPRVLARTTTVTRRIVVLKDGIIEQEEPSRDGDGPSDNALDHQRFCTAFLKDLKLDDPQQPKANPALAGYVTFSLPARTSWLTVYRNVRDGQVGLYLSSWRNISGGDAMQAIVDDFDTIKDELVLRFGISDQNPGWGVINNRWER